MSKHMNSPLDRNAIRRQLLVTVSAAALTGWSIQTAYAADADKPLLWVEFGGDASMVNGEGEPLTAPFMTTFATSKAFDPLSPTEIQKPPRFSFGEDASIAFQPENSDWIFSAAIRYGRSSNRRDVHQQSSGLTLTPSVPIFPTVGTHVQAVQNYADYQVYHSEKHTVLDFKAGKDVGLGLFGGGSTSELDIGVRMARFETKSSIDMKARVNVGLFYYSIFKYFTNYALDGSSTRSFHGIGPSLSWSNSIPLAGNLNDGELALDWGINGAILFGKQKAKTRHNTTGKIFHQKYEFFFGQPSYATPVHVSANPPLRSRSVTVPNIGGSVALSYKFNDAKLSIGYRYDSFLKAMDTGIDTARKANMTFQGPYASISIGLGD